MQKQHKIKVDITKKYAMPAFEVNTNDLKSIRLSIEVLNGASPLDLKDKTVRIAIRKPDNNIVFQDCTITDAANGQVEVILENQAYITPGTHTAEIMCYKGSDVVAVSGTLSYKSSKGIMNDEAVESKSEFTAITNMLRDVEETIEEIRENGTGVDAQARQGVQQVTAQVADNAKINKTCSSLGLIPSNQVEAANNYTKLIDAMRTGYRIVVDNDYFIDGKITEPVQRDISLLGVNGTLRLTSNTTSILFSKSVRVENVKIISIFNESATHLFVNDNNNEIESIEFIGNEYHGNISTLSIDRGTIQSPSKIKRFVFDNNKLYNRTGLWVYLNKLDFDSIEINNNKIRNMDMQIFNINNSVNSKAVVNVKANSVVNDMDLWVKAPTNYLCFLLYAGGGRVSYKNNEVIGLKTKVGNANVYDNYISCDWLEYDNNVWQDNITVSPTRGKNGLIKGKTGGDSLTIYRSCRKNKFHMSKELLDSLTPEEKTRCYVTLWDFSSTLSTFTYEGNDVDVYNLHQNEFDEAILAKFQNNTIYAQKITGNIINFDPIPGSKLIVNNNTVKAIDVAPQSFYGESKINSSNSHDEIIMENNTIRMGFNQFLYTPKTKVLVFNNNVIENLNSSTSVAISLMHYGKIGKMTGANNKLFSLADMVTFRPQSTVSEIDLGVDISRKMYKFAESTIVVPFDDVYEQAKQVVASYNVLHKGEQCIFNLFFEVGKDATGMYVKYKTNATDWITQYNDGTYNNASIDKINSFSFNVQTRVILDKANKIASFRLDLPPYCTERVHLKTFTTPVAV